MNNSTKDWIKKLDLRPHPEGGYFMETYRSDLEMAFPGFSGKGNTATGIYFLLEEGIFPAFHRIKSDEMWHFCTGDGVIIYVIDRSGTFSTIRLGVETGKGEVPQAVLKAGSWFAPEVNSNGECAFVGGTVSPGFDFEDFEMGDRSEPMKAFPDHLEVFMRLTRNDALT